ncbi:MAG: PEP-CTERM sorting domain-containing protein [Verrucomicrobia bacterium]|nr:PEP-CTERM sorting domain-containing protein [Verrucomicrobiota bacterium]
MLKTTTGLCSVALLLAAAPQSRAAIVLSGDFVNGTTTPTLTITEDIVFNITSTSSVESVIFDEWTTSDGGQDVAYRDPLGQSLAYLINNSPAMVLIGNLYDNLAANYGDFTPNDGYLALNGLSVTAGDTLVIKAGSFVFSSSLGFNSLLDGTTFTGVVFLADGNGDRISGNGVAVPEPSSVLLCGLGTLALLRRRR